MNPWWLCVWLSPRIFESPRWSSFRRTKCVYWLGKDATPRWRAPNAWLRKILIAAGTKTSAASPKTASKISLSGRTAGASDHTHLCHWPLTTLIFNRGDFSLLIFSIFKYISEQNSFGYNKHSQQTTVLYNWNNIPTIHIDIFKKALRAFYAIPKA